MQQRQLKFRFSLQRREWVAINGDDIAAKIMRVPAGWHAQLRVRQHVREGFYDNALVAQSEAQALMNRLLAS